MYEVIKHVGVPSCRLLDSRCDSENIYRPVARAAGNKLNCIYACVSSRPIRSDRINRTSNALIQQQFSSAQLIVKPLLY